MEILLNEIFDSQSIIVNLKSRTKEEAFAELTGAIAAVHPECDSEAMLAALWEREKKMSIGIASGVAIPHAMCQAITKIAGAIGISRGGIDYDALDHKPVYVVFMLAMGVPAEESHLRILNQIFKLAQSEALASIRNAKNNKDVYTILSRFR
jgi:PTS system fructose-specific IIC component/PTS system nitrogen regulatory IIA component